jgi:hypothetical protein
MTFLQIQWQDLKTLGGKFGTKKVIEAYQHQVQFETLVKIMPTMNTNQN